MENKNTVCELRRIVQDERYFFKIKPGLWALLSYKERLPEYLRLTETLPKHKEEIFTHTYYQGLLVEIGNLKKYETFVPNQDKNRLYLEKRLGDVCSQNDFFEFGYDHLVRRTKTIDVCWFNNRKMPSKLFEVEHSTDIQNSLLKFMDLQDYTADFYIVANTARNAEYKNKLSFNAFLPIKERVQFMDYDRLSEWHSKTYEITALEKGLL